jgi:hypothetical protein
MKRRTTGLFAGALLAFGVCTTAIAGFHQGQAVVINDASGFANGDLGFVHNTPDNIQYIGCNSSGNIARCFARNLAGLSRACSTPNPTHLAAIHSLSGDSYLIFGWDAAGQCTFINVQNSSLTVPKN